MRRSSTRSSSVGGATDDDDDKAEEATEDDAPSFVVALFAPPTPLPLERLMLPPTAEVSSASKSSVHLLSSRRGKGKRRLKVA